MGNVLIQFLNYKYFVIEIEYINCKFDFEICVLFGLFDNCLDLFFIYCFSLGLRIYLILNMWFK